MNDTLAPLPPGAGSPFYYNSLSHLVMFFAVPPESIDLNEGGDHFTSMSLSGQSIASISAQRYIADFGSDAVVVTEVELATLVLPKSNTYNFTSLSPEDFLRGEEQSFTIGLYPIAVACDAKAAVDAGITLFGEPKFLADLSFSAPSFNDGDNTSRWSFGYTRRQRREGYEGLQKFSLECDLSPLDSSPANAGVVTTYGQRDGSGLGSRWNILQTSTVHLPPEDGGRPPVKISNSDPVVAPFVHAIHEGTVVGCREHRSSPVAARGRPFNL